MISEDKERKIIELLKKYTSDIGAIRSIALGIKTDDEAEKLINYINSNSNLTIKDINWEVLKIKAPRRGFVL